MTKKELVKIIQEAVRREVKKEVGKIFIKEEVSSLSSMTQEIKAEPQKQKHFSKDEAINKVLNETKGGIQGQKSEYPTLGGGVFDTSKMAELMGYGKSEEVKRDMVAIDTLKKQGKSVNDVPESLTKALTRDYSDLIKAMDKKGK